MIFILGTYKEPGYGGVQYSLRAARDSENIETQKTSG